MSNRTKHVGTHKTFGIVMKRIIIEADERGTMRVSAMEQTKFGPAPTPLDSREMVLALLRVVQEYTSALFAEIKTNDDTGGAGNGHEASNEGNVS